MIIKENVHFRFLRDCNLKPSLCYGLFTWFHYFNIRTRSWNLHDVINIPKCDRHVRMYIHTYILRRLRDSCQCAQQFCTWTDVAMMWLAWSVTRHYVPKLVLHIIAKWVKTTLRSYVPHIHIQPCAVVKLLQSGRDMSAHRTFDWPLDSQEKKL